MNPTCKSGNKCTKLGQAKANVSSLPGIFAIAPTGSVQELWIALYQNNPNLFNPSATIKFDVPALSEGALEISLTVFNLLSQKVATLFAGVVAAGTARDCKFCNGAWLLLSLYAVIYENRWFIGRQMLKVCLN